MEKKEKFMKLALKEAELGVRKGSGGPFGAVIVRKGRVVSKGRNRVPSSKDPTAHAEIVAIRGAARKLGSFDLSGCEIYSTCEPCPMCLAAIHWARIERIHFGATRKDAAKIGFDDEFFYDILKGKRKGVPAEHIGRGEILPIMKEWHGKKGKVNY